MSQTNEAIVLRKLISDVVKGARYGGDGRSSEPATGPRQ
jgi:hypothetical protein